MLDEQKRKLVLDNINLVYHLARKLGYDFEKDEDAIQYGMLGLCIAADRFDPNRGVKFSTYAYSYIIHWLEGTYSDIKMKERIDNGMYVSVDDLSYIISDEFVTDEKEELEEILLKAKKELREVFLLLLAGYSRKEISKKINKSQSTISCWISKFKEEINNGRNQ